MRCVLLVLAAALTAAEPGDPGVVPEPARFLPAFPAMARWAGAGVTGGVPVPGAARVTVQPGEDLAAALAGGGTIRLAAGEHRLARVVRLAEGTDVVGAGADATRIVLEGEAALVVERVGRVGLRGLRLSHAAAEPELAARPPEPRILASRRAVAGVPDAHVALALRDVRECWIEDCVLVGLPDTPLAIEGGTRLTLRRLRIDGVVHRGDGHGVLRLHGVSDSLLHRLDVDGIRLVRLSGATVGNVIGGSAFAVPIHFADSAAVADNLFEANLHALPPGSPWRAFAYHIDPIGHGNLMVDSRSYAQGTDAVVPGVLPRPGAVLAFATHPQRATWDAEKSGWRGTPFLAPPRAPAAPAPTAGAPAATGGGAAIDAPADLPAEAGPRIPLLPGPVVGLVWSAGPLAADWDQLPAGAPAPGRDGLTALPPERVRDGSIDALGLAGGDQRRLVLGAVLTVAADAEVVPNVAGAESVWWCSGQRLVPGRPVLLKTGVHPLWGVVKVVKANPFVKRIDVRLVLAPAGAPTGLPESAPVAVPELPDPPGGTLYAASAALDRGWLADWDAAQAVHRQLAQAEPQGLDAALSALAARGDTPVGRLGRRWQAIVERVEAGTRELPDDYRRWRARSTAYLVAGLPQRSWAFEKLIGERWPGAPEELPERWTP